MTSPVLAQVHTYAQDIEAVRSGRGTTTPPKTPPVTTPTTAPVVPDEVKREALTTDTTVHTATEKAAAKKSAVTSSAPIKISTTATRDASYPATIITDKKRAKINVSAEVTNALGNWWKEKVKGVTQSKKRSYTVPAATMRKGVIESATSHTGRSATTDHEQIVARLKAEKANRQATPAVLQKPPTPKAPPVETWNTDTASTSQPAIEPSATPVQSLEPNLSASTLVTQAQALATPGTPTTALEPSRVSVPPIVTRPKITPTIPVTPIVKTVVTTPLNPVTELVTPITPQIPSTLTATKEAVASRKETLLDASPQPKSSDFSLNIPWHLTPYIAAGAVTLVLMSSLGFMLVNRNGEQTPITTTLPTMPANTIVTTTNTPQVSAQLDAPNKNSLFNTIKNNAGQGDTFFVIAPLAPNTGLPLTKDEILLLINRQFSADFLSTVTAVSLGMYRNAPVITLTTSNEAALRGHLFTWEASMSRDLSPWFTIENGTTSPTFVDGQSAGRDIRILTKSDATEQIVYGFSDRNTVIITTDSTAFLNLADTYIK